MTEKSLLDLTDDYMRQLLLEINSGKEDIGLKEKVDFARELSRWAMMRNKISPESSEGSKIREYTNALRSGNSGRSTYTRKAEKAETPPETKTHRRDGKSQCISVPSDDSSSSGSTFGSILNDGGAFRS